MFSHNNPRIALISVLIFSLLSLIVVSPSLGAMYAVNGSEISPDSLSDLIQSDPTLLSGSLPPSQVIFFFNTHCGACHDAMAFLDGFAPNHTEMTLLRYDLFNSTENRTIFESYKKTYNRNFLSVPSLIIGNVSVEGVQDISNHLEELLVLQKQHSGSSDLFSNIFTSPSLTSDSPSGEIPLLLIIGAGLLDGINPCAFAVLVFLLVYLMAQKSRKMMLTAGLVYTGAVFIFYYLSGLGIFTIIQTTGATTIFSFVAGCIALIAGLVMVKDALFPKEKPTLGIPASQSGLINRVMKQATIPAAFILGILVGMFELPCTGGIYLSIISMISMKSNMTQALGYLFVYNIAFVLPLLIILILVTFGLPPERVNEWRLEQRRLLRGIIGLVLIGFAVFILYEVLG
ncbi:hypothetical protein KHC33_10715 [Methanospirillum sp. J.3.6.1-F.2.7.3]|uniref:Cytochrome c biogenesis protein n=1 Tax=Methanospirillum purgamenti TaxID=2834276 RepID=A0A8E7AZS6_9EURY|nr:MULTISPECIES: cytochrome c biogenesis protein CcdA [Methanospirillum]MDX8551687.1 cytochrome c biogenesis protein CcdA [Methanospirillum hungatei]QVV87813.1 hypothetical protein KHC33_10715 [Methanospirillum sp. J.3.6.1-F.2.7.3]